MRTFSSRSQPSSQSTPNAPYTRILGLQLYLTFHRVPTCQAVAGHFASAKLSSFLKTPSHPYLCDKFSTYLTPCAHGNIHCPYAGFSHIRTDFAIITVDLPLCCGSFMYLPPASPWVETSIRQSSSMKLLRKHLANIYSIELVFVLMTIILIGIGKRKLKTKETELGIYWKFIISHMQAII